MSKNNKEKIFIVAERNNIETEDDIFIVRSDSIYNVLDAYAKEYYTKNDLFIERFEDRSINMSFWEQFFFNGIYNDNFKTDLSYDEIKERFEKNIKEYLGDNEYFLQELIDFYYDEDKILEDLSQELIDYIAIKEVQEEAELMIIKEI